MRLCNCGPSIDGIVSQLQWLRGFVAAVSRRRRRLSALTGRACTFIFLAFHMVLASGTLELCVYACPEHFRSLISGPSILDSLILSSTFAIIALAFHTRDLTNLQVVSTFKAFASSFSVKPYPYSTSTSRRVSSTFHHHVPSVTRSPHRPR